MLYGDESILHRAFACFVDGFLLEEFCLGLELLGGCLQQGELLRALGGLAFSARSSADHCRHELKKPSFGRKTPCA